MNRNPIKYLFVEKYDTTCVFPLQFLSILIKKLFNKLIKYHYAFYKVKKKPKIVDSLTTLKWVFRTVQYNMYFSFFYFINMSVLYYIVNKIMKI